MAGSVGEKLDDLKRLHPKHYYVEDPSGLGFFVSLNNNGPVVSVGSGNEKINFRWPSASYLVLVHTEDTELHKALISGLPEGAAQKMIEGEIMHVASDPDWEGCFVGRALISSENLGVTIQQITIDGIRSAVEAHSKSVLDEVPKRAFVAQR